MTLKSSAIAYWIGGAADRGGDLGLPALESRVARKGEIGELCACRDEGLHGAPARLVALLGDLEDLLLDRVGPAGDARLEPHGHLAADVPGIRLT